MDCSYMADCLRSIENTEKKYTRCEIQQCLKSCDTRRFIVVGENGKRYELQNRGDTIVVYQVDGQMISSQDMVKCDNMIVDVTAWFAILIEFKGTDLRHALRQMEGTFNRVSSALKKYKVYGRIITSPRTNVPSIKTDPQYIKIQKLFMGHRGNLKTGQNNMSEPTSEFV